MEINVYAAKTPLSRPREAAFPSSPSGSAIPRGFVRFLFTIGIRSTGFSWPRHSKKE